VNSSQFICILGAGGHAKVVASCLIAGGKSIRGFYDDDSSKQGQEVFGFPVLGPISDCGLTRDVMAIFGIGSNRTRMYLDRLWATQSWATAIHPTAWLDPSVEVGAGTVVFAGAVVQPGAKIGRHCILNTGCTVDHDCILDDFVHLAPGVHLAGNVSIGEGAFLGIGTKAIPGVTVGCWSQIGAGGIIVGDIPDHVLAVGVPARVVKNLEAK
jgi:sugar O-acyltransferase (sialic acid O-acetyltransferase NeuD family)